MIFIDKESRIPLYKQVYDQIKASIAGGMLKIGASLTATRALAEQLSISRNTVESAYQLLASESYITGRMGSGYTVSDNGQRLFSNRPERAGAGPAKGPGS